MIIHVNHSGHRQGSHRSSPNFLSNLDKMNKILAESVSDKKRPAEEYVKTKFEKAMKETMLRAEAKQGREVMAARVSPEEIIRMNQLYNQPLTFYTEKT